MDVARKRGAGLKSCGASRGPHEHSCIQEFQYFLTIPIWRRAHITNAGE